jgi:hypothetical protein
MGFETVPPKLSPLAEMALTTMLLLAKPSSCG